MAAPLFPIYISSVRIRFSPVIQTVDAVQPRDNPNDPDFPLMFIMQLEETLSSTCGGCTRATDISYCPEKDV